MSPLTNRARQEPQLPALQLCGRFSPAANAASSTDRPGITLKALLELVRLTRMGSVSIVGCGYTGLKLAQRWLALGATVRGFASRAASLELIHAVGAQAEPLNLDGTPGAPAARIDVDGHVVYYSVPPPAHGSGDSRLEAFFGAVA